MEIELTPEEKKAIAALKRVAKIWPKSLWLFSASGTLHVMRNGEDGNPVYEHSDEVRDGGCDPDYSITTINIANDGGDW